MAQALEEIYRMNSNQRVLTALAFTGLFAGLAGCDKSSGEGDTAKAESSASAMPAMGGESTDKNCCMGKNECKGKGGCAVPESHACAGQNDCKGKGGCNAHCPK